MREQAGRDEEHSHRLSYHAVNGGRPWLLCSMPLADTSSNLWLRVLYLSISGVTSLVHLLCYKCPSFSVECSISVF